MARFRCGLVLLGALTLVAVSCGSSEPETGQLNLDRAGQEIHDLAVRVYRGQADIGAVRCPDSVPIQEHLIFICTVEINGAPLVFRVRQQDDHGNVRFEQAQAVISTKKMEAFVKSSARKTGKPASEVSCGRATVLIRNPGTKVSCTVELKDGATGVATLRVQDAGGKVALIGIERSTR